MKYLRPSWCNLKFHTLMNFCSFGILFLLFSPFFNFKSVMWLLKILINVSVVLDSLTRMCLIIESQNPDRLNLVRPELETHGLMLATFTQWHTMYRLSTETLNPCWIHLSGLIFVLNSTLCYVWTYIWINPYHWSLSVCNLLLSVW